MQTKTSHGKQASAKGDQTTSMSLQVSPTLYLAVHTDNNPTERKRVEQFLEAVYAEKYGAELTSHYPVLMSAQDRDGTILAAIGFRFAEDEAPFLAQYLDDPVETAVSRCFRVPVARNQIVEIGSLAANGQGPLWLLFLILSTYLHDQGYEYAMVTGTNTLQALFKRIGLDLAVITDADQNRLPDAGASWGSYYDTDPKVMVGRIDDCHRILQRFSAQVRLLDMSGLFACLHHRFESALS